jgi:methylenetetrahydrofolate dehydrogenase (NADP+) / methenyltetrahydrofolate cyclohydrolase
MTAVLDGKAVAAPILAQTATQAAEFLRGHGRPPTLAILVANDDDSSAWYVRTLVRTAERNGLGTQVLQLDPTADEATVLTALEALAADPAVDGIVLQTPLPAGVPADRLVSAIPFGKDVDGANPLSAGRLLAGLPAFAPATAAAVLAILEHYQVTLEGASAVVMGRSMVVGKPTAHLLLARNATVTMVHSRTRDLAEVTRRAEVLVAAIGKPGLVGPDHVGEGAVVVDVGTTPDADGKLRGDVDAAAVDGVAGALTPVPGGVGPVTTALVLRHTLVAANST